MAPERTKEQMDAIKAAMMADIGVGRIENLHMEDGENERRSRVHVEAPRSVQPRPAAKMNNKWLQAIENGKFDDDDAAQVNGMDSMEDGNLARIRRQAASDAATNFVTANYRERDLPRDERGNVAPRTSFRGQGRNSGRAPPIWSHEGDGPIDMARAVSHGLRTAGLLKPLPKPSPARVSSGPSKPVSKPVLPATDASQVAALNKPGPEAEPAAPAPVVPQADATQAKAQISSNSDNKESQLRLTLPDGASIVFKTSPVITSGSFPRKPEGYPGTVYLVETKNPAADAIILSLQDPEIGDIRHLVEEFDDIYPSDRAGIMIRFKVSGGTAFFYCLDFGETDKMVSFMRATRELQRHWKQSIQDPVAAPAVSVATPTAPKTNAPSELGQRAAQVEVRAAEPATQTVETVPMGKTPIPTAAANAQGTLDTPMVKMKTAAMVVTPAQVSPTAIEAPQSTGDKDPKWRNFIDETTNQVMETSECMRKMSPDEFGVDTIRVLIRATATMVVKHENHEFQSLSLEKQAEFVNQLCLAVEGEFLARLSRSPAFVAELSESIDSVENADAKAKEEQQSTELQPTLKDQEAQKPVTETQVLTGSLTRAKSQEAKISTEELLSMRPSAAPGFQWLKEVDFGVDTQRKDQPQKPKSYHSVSDQIKRVAVTGKWVSSSIAPLLETLPESTAKAEVAKKTETLAEKVSFARRDPNDIIGLFVMNAAIVPDVQIQLLFSPGDRDKILAVSRFGAANKVVHFGSEEDRDGSLERLPQEYKNHFDRTKLLFKVFEVKDKPEMIGLFATNAATLSDTEICDLFAAEDRLNIIAVKTLGLGGASKVVQFRTTKHRDLAMVGLAEEYKTGRDRATPLFKIFVPRSDKETTETMGQTKNGMQSSSWRKLTTTTQEAPAAGSDQRGATSNVDELETFMSGNAPPSSSHYKAGSVLTGLNASRHNTGSTVAGAGSCSRELSELFENTSPQPGSENTDVQRITKRLKDFTL